MKTIEWQDCLSRGAVGSYPPEEGGKMLDPGGDVITGMKVFAKYSDLTIILEIQKEIEHHVFCAVVVGFEPVLGEKPAGINQGDEVIIQRKNICCLFA